jgi:diguanylate cyclase (GGDEF)-like protein
VVIGVNRAVLYRSLYGHLALAVLSVATFIFAGIALAWIFSRYIRDALHALEAATQAAAAGDFGVRAPTTGPREIARLAAQFNDMQTARKKAEEEIAALAHKDPLTNLPNRRLLLDRILQSLAHADRLHGCMAVCYLDLDGFKPVNDTYGHEAGDHVLVEVAHRLGQATRTHDTVARLGGDEFVLVLDDLKSREECDAIITRVLDIISEPISLQGGHLVKISASIGFTLYPGDSHDPETLLRHCDQALYRAKGAGRNRVRFFDPRQDSSVA